MKSIWILLLFSFAFFFLVKPICASKPEIFDPTAKYIVHSIPVIVSDPVTIKFSNNVTNPSQNVSSDHYALPIPSAEHTQEAGSEGDQDPLLSQYTLPSNPEPKIDLTPLTAAAMLRKPSLFSQTKAFFSSFFSGVSSTVQNHIVFPVKNGLTGISNFATNSFHSLSNSIQSTSRTVSSNVKGLANIFHHFSTELAWMKDQAVSRAKAWFFRLPPKVTFVGLTALALAPLAFNYMRVRYKKTIKIYAISIAIVLTAAFIYVAAPIVVESAAELVTALSEATALEIAVHTVNSVQKTAADCLSYPGQCDSLAGAATDFGFNFVVGASPNLGGQVVEEEGVAVKVVKNAENIATNEVNVSLELGKVIISGKDYALSEHALERIQSRQISEEQLKQTLSVKPFEYFHDNVWKKGFYDPHSQIFVGLGDTITTIIVEAKPQYIKNLQSAKP